MKTLAGQKAKDTSIDCTFRHTGQGGGVLSCYGLGLGFLGFLGPIVVFCLRGEGGSVWGFFGFWVLGFRAVVYGFHGFRVWGVGGCGFQGF